MTSQARPPLDSASRRAAAKALASELIAAAPPGDRFAAAEIIRQHPDLAQYKSVAIDLAYEEFCRTSAKCSPQEFAQRFPDFEQSLLRVLEVHQWFQGEAFLERSWPQPGEEFAGFRLIEEIGRGAFSRVYIAREPAVGEREVVVKICDDAGVEVDRLGRLSGHPHIVPVHAVYRDPVTQLYAICMPSLGTTTLLDTLDSFFQTGAPPSTASESSPAAAFTGPDAFARHVERVVGWCAQLCDALDLAHSRGIVHSDIKPSNVLITDDGIPMLLDFNLSVRRDAEPQRMGGTLPYMAPEQLALIVGDAADDDSQIDASSDIFSLGVLLYHLVTGKIPFSPPDDCKSRPEAAAAMREQQRRGAFDRAALQRAIGTELARVVSGCLAFDKLRRPSSAKVLAQQLRAYLSPSRKRRRWLISHLGTVGAALLLLAGLATAGGVLYAGRPAVEIREYRSGIASFDRADWVAAERHLTLALESRRNFPEALLARGWSLIKAAEQAGLDETARSISYTRAYEDFILCDQLTGSPAAQAAAAYAQCLRGVTLHEATLKFEAAIAGGLESASLWNNLGYCQNRTQDPREAAESFMRALALSPDLPEAHFNLALLELRLAHTDSSAGGEHLRQAVHHIEKAGAPKSPSADVALAALRIYAAALQNADSAQSDRYRSQFFKCYQAAIDLGLTPEQAGQNRDVQLVLQSEPQFIPTSQPDGRTAAPPARPAGLADIFPDVRAHLLSAL